MQTYTLSQLTEETLKALVTLHERDSESETWGKMQDPLTPEESLYLNLGLTQRVDKS